jgi:small subunit ribosomal protein S9
LNDKGYLHATGRRKCSIAQVRINSGGGAIIVNGKPLEEMFPIERHRNTILEPLVVTDNLEKFSITVKVTGGGCCGQAGAIRHGIARAIVVYDANLKKLLKTHGLLTRDARVKERKKYGLVKARKAKQYTKR